MDKVVCQLVVISARQTGYLGGDNALMSNYNARKVAHGHEIYLAYSCGLWVYEINGLCEIALFGRQQESYVTIGLQIPVCAWELAYKCN